MKLIVNPNECGHQSKVYHIKKGSTTAPLCQHPTATLMNTPCTNSRNFPTNCPLQDGMTREQFLEEQKPNIIHVKHGSFKGLKQDLTGIKPSKPRRSRKNCIHYGGMSHGYNPYCASRKRFSGSCDGVNCGHYDEGKHI